jgi:hypothetical protein
MKFIELYKYSGFIYLVSLTEFEFNSVSFVIDLGPNVDDSPPQVKIDFNEYISYSIRNESYVTGDDSEIYAGGSFRMYTKSAFLNYVDISTFANGAHPGLIQHYAICCSNHIIDIATIHEPTISQVQ